MSTENAHGPSDGIDCDVPPATPRVWLITVAGMFALTGFSFASWVTQTPAVRDALHISTSRMGLLLLALAVGSITGLVVASRLIGHRGARAAVGLGITLSACGLAGVAVGTAVGSQIVVAAALAVFGFGNGVGDVGINVEGSALERRMKRTVLPAIHACYSAGSLVGAAMGAVVIKTGASAPVHLLVIALLCGIVLAATIRLIPAGEGIEVRHDPSTPVAAVERVAVWRDSRLIFIGIVVLAMAFAEGSAFDWLPLAMVDGYGASHDTAAVAYAVFVTAMMVVRLLGGFIVDRFGRVATLRTTALLGAFGLALVVADINTGVAFVGVALWAIGAALGFPVGLSAAGDDPGRAAARVGAVATIGYVAFLAGPPLLGALTHQVGLLTALIAVLVGLVVAVFFVPATRTLESTR